MDAAEVAGTVIKQSNHAGSVAARAGPRKRVRLLLEDDTTRASKTSLGVIIHGLSDRAKLFAPEREAICAIRKPIDA